MDLPQDQTIACRKNNHLSLHPCDDRSRLHGAKCRGSDRPNISPSLILELGEDEISKIERYIRAVHQSAYLDVNVAGNASIHSDTRTAIVERSAEYRLNYVAMAWINGKYVITLVTSELAGQQSRVGTSDIDNGRLGGSERAEHRLADGTHLRYMTVGNVDFLFNREQ